DSDGRIEYLYHEDGEIRYQGGIDNHTVVDAPQTLTMRLTSDGEDVSAAYSRDGSSWTDVGRPAPVSQYENAQFGFFAAHGPNEIETPATATFSDFSLCVGDDGPEPGQCVTDE